MASSGRRTARAPGSTAAQADECSQCRGAMTEESSRTVDSRPTSPGGGMTSSVTRRERSLLLSPHCNLRPIRGSSPYRFCGGRSHLLSGRVSHIDTRAGGVATARPCGGSLAVCTYADDRLDESSASRLTTFIARGVNLIKLWGLMHSRVLFSEHTSRGERTALSWFRVWCCRLNRAVVLKQIGSPTARVRVGRVGSAVHRTQRWPTWSR